MFRWNRSIRSLSNNFKLMWLPIRIIRLSCLQVCLFQSQQSLKYLLLSMFLEIFKICGRNLRFEGHYCQSWEESYKYWCPGPKIVPEDRVWLSTKNIRLMFQRAPKFIGPLQVFKQFNPVIFCHYCFQEWCLCGTFFSGGIVMTLLF